MNHLARFALISAAGALSARAAITDNLVAYWDFESSTANHPAASGGSAYNGTLMGDAVITGGVARVGTGSLVLDGTGDYLDVTSIVDPNQPWSASAWYRAAVAPAGSARFFVFESSGSYPLSFGLREGSPATGTNHQAFADVTPAADVSADFQIPDIETAATWNHVVLAFTPATEESSGSLRVFINGVLRSTRFIAFGNTLVGANGLHIGTYRNADGRWFNGVIDEVALWNRSLGDFEAQEVFVRGSQGATLTSAGFTVALGTNPTGTGTVAGSGLYEGTAVVPISATPNPGYVFEGWDGDFTGQPASFTYTANSSANATARFGEDRADPDGDKLTNYEEIVIYQTNPDHRDTDGDRIPDGDEVEITFTNPKGSDAALVDFVRYNLGPETVGAIALSPLRLDRDPSTGAVSLFLSLSGSATQSGLQGIDLSHPSVSIVPAGDGWNVTFPAPSNSVNRYLVIGSRP